MIRILLVDDSATMRRIVKNSLRSMGFDGIEEAESGAAALERLARGGIDCLIVDAVMPEMSGIDLLRHIRATPEHTRLPVLMVIGAGDEDSVVRGLAAGFNAYVVKPFDPATLAARLQQILTEPAVRA
jgi:two-component system chemotaxis response regulator CheY